MNPFFYINVAELMKEKVPIMLPRPKLKPTVLVNDGEWLPIIGVECEE